MIIIRRRGRDRLGDDSSRRKGEFNRPTADVKVTPSLRDSEFQQDAAAKVNDLKLLAIDVFL